MDTYLQYTPHVVLAEYASKKEFDTNIVFQNFIRTQEKLAECRKLPFRHFLILPVTRLQRYVLLLDAVLKKTASDHPDKEKLAKAIDIIKTVAAKADEKTLISKNTLRVLEISDRIRFKAGEYHSLDLLEPGRKLIMESALTRKSQLNVETVELQVFLFDHMLIMTKPKIPANSSLDIEYYVSKKPIPIQFLQVQDYNESFSIGLKARRGNTSTLNNTHSSNQFVPGSTPPTPGGNFPLVFQYLGRNGADYVVSADSAATRTSWKEKINQAKDAFEKTQSDKHVFDIQTLSDTTFALAGTQNNGLVTCSVPFKGPNDIGMVAIGTQQGVWVGLEGKPLSFSLVLSVVDVTSIGVLEDHNIFLILAGK